jgi:acyl-CoA thioester hydrolase
MPSLRIHFAYQLYNEKDELINEGETTLVFIDIKRNKPCLPAADFLKRLQHFFD